MNFDRAYVVHLPNAERRRVMEAQLAQLGWQAEFLHAVPPKHPFNMTNMRRAPRGEFGANVSHLKAVLRAVADGAERPLFLEDDVTFCADAKERIKHALAALPPHWDLLYLGGHPRSPVKQVADGLYKVGTFSCAEAYVMRRPALLRFAEFWCSRITQPHAMYDFILGEFAAEHAGYAVYPVITEQRPGLSLISCVNDDKRELVERGWQSNR